MSHAWLFNELAAAGREHLDAEQVAAYDAKAQFDPAPDLALLKVLGLSRTSWLMDVGGGTGTFALQAAKECQQVILVDPSPAMMEAAARKAQAEGIQNLTLIEDGFLSFEVKPVDFIFCRNALHHLPDFWKVQALMRLRTALKPGGVLRLLDLVYSFSPAQTEERFAAWLGHAEKSTLGGYPCAELETHIREEHSTFTWLLEPMLERSGFQIEQATSSPSGIFAAYVCRAV
ncbi:class I SAM-dependent methyltransferase [Deinococcus radiopugnans]|uniref:Class I SAM-dependent methyltransferase n=1 Tax=Deinococcus radiopugnans ATCC 19172 TaxID=585398 RepID=A0A5C4Y4A7_9DEIO|nr:class I SAM-dependent methyltransferase [Deinococcus radiopugnans]MBB6017640.1 ubiquinone/menaquinone biosynthesis C-methylase UbiE [Deinococcus radiopugnans ATCC 19172]TNM70357.1 class I SAM-dependent methyltransferase [Deinococcus radiopugnans ATCC 19172]